LRKDPWQDFADSVEIVEGRKPVPPASDEALDDFERRTGFRLPLSYRSFVKRFGPGTLAQRFDVTAPGYAGESSDVDIDELRAFFVRVTSDGELEESYDDPERAHRLVIFCHATGEDLFGWDPREVTDPAAHEYAVYEVPRHEDRLNRLAATFAGFINDYCLGDGHLRVRGGAWDEEALGPRRHYSRADHMPRDRPRTRRR